MENYTVGLVRPTAVQLAAAVLVSIPMMDILSGQRSGIFMYGIVSWVLVCGAGISLMIRHKSSWIMGTIFCGSFVAINLYEIAFQSPVGVDPWLTAFKFINCLLVAVIVATVFCFFRYPYLDRRQNWFAPTGERFKVEMPVIVNGDLGAKTLDLSYTGARIVLDAAASFKPGQSVSLQMTDINDVVCQAKIVAIHDGWIRVHFEDASKSEKELIRQWLLSQNLQKV
ncbi:MAG: PilZ domain-containing protein [Bacillota bacterium]